MKLRHRRHEETAQPVGYDAQSDLALPTQEHPEQAGDLTTPFGGSLVPTENGPGYDVDRDTGF